jgi:hypothetical protein
MRTAHCFEINPILLFLQLISNHPFARDSFSHPSGSSLRVFYLKASPDPSRRQAGPENVQCRSVFIQFQRVVVRQPRLTSNPFLTHGTVESPLKVVAAA